MKCWICNKTQKEIEESMEEVIEEDLSELGNIKPEEAKEFKFFSKNKFYICGICWRLLNNFIDKRHECLHDCVDFNKTQMSGLFEIKKIE